MKTFFSKKKNIVISCVVAVVVIGGVVGGIFYNNHVKEQRANELRLESITKDLETANSAVIVLYSDETEKFLADDLTQEQLDSAKEALATIEAYAQTEPLMQESQSLQYTNLVTEYDNAVSMNDIAILYTSFYSPVEQPDISASSDSAILADTSEIVEESQTEQTSEPLEQEAITPYVLAKTDSTETNLTLLSEKLEAIKEIKPDFYSLYIEKKTNLETTLLTMQETIDLVNSLFSEDGSVVESATSEQYDNAVTKVNELTNPTVKEELSAKLQTVTDTLNQRAQAQAEKEQAEAEANQKAQSTKNGTKSNTANSKGNNSSTKPSTNGNGNASANSQTTNNTTNNGNQSNNTTNNNNTTPTTPTQPTTPTEPTIKSGYIGSLGLFNSMAELNSYARQKLSDSLLNDDNPYTGYTVVNVVYSDGTVKFSGDLY